MKRLTQLLAMAGIGLTALAAPQAAAQGRITYENTQDGEQNVNYKFWVCIR